MMRKFMYNFFLPRILLWFILWPKALLFEIATKHPLRTQKKLLSKLLKRNKNTMYGLEHGFKYIKSIPDYQKKLDINSYEYFRKYVDKLLIGEKNTLTKDEPIFFATTSGTTGKKKFIPATRSLKKKKAEAFNIAYYHMAKKYLTVASGKILVIVSNCEESYTQAGIPYGSDTGFVSKSTHPILQRYFALPSIIYGIKDYDSRYYCILRIALEQNITCLATVNPSTLLILAKKIYEYRSSLITDLVEGTLAETFKIDKDIRKIIEKKLKPNPDKANFLKSLLKKKNNLLAKDIWPNLKLIVCWKEGSVKLYLRELPKYFGQIPIWPFGYCASEATCSIPVNDDVGGVLATKTNFYEFIPKEDIDKENKRILLCNQLEAGEEYLIIITNLGGLYRYNIDDIIKVKGFYNQTPMIEFVQKGSNVTSITGEKLYESQVIEAVEKAKTHLGLILESFLAGIQWGDKPAYAFLVEFGEDPSYAQKVNFIKSIDSQLKKINSEYDTKRKSQRLNHPVLKILEKGSFQKYRQKRVADGAHDGQFKLTKLTNDFSFQDNFKIVEERYI